MRHVYFVRHAIALDRDVWHHPDEHRPLTEAGHRQAEGIRHELRRARIERVISSRAYRCMDTVWPLADALGLKVATHDALYEGSRASAVFALIRRTKIRNLALCTHGDVMQDVLEELDDDGIDLDGGLRFAKGAYWVFDADDRGAIRSGDYHTAPRG